MAQLPAKTSRLSFHLHDITACIVYNTLRHVGSGDETILLSHMTAPLHFAIRSDMYTWSCMYPEIIERAQIYSVLLYTSGSMHIVKEI